MNERYSWIASKTGYDADDIMDIILGNITEPKGQVKEVLDYSCEYDLLKTAQRLNKALDS